MENRKWEISQSSCVWNSSFCTKSSLLDVSTTFIESIFAIRFPDRTQQDRTPCWMLRNFSFRMALWLIELETERFVNKQFVLFWWNAIYGAVVKRPVTFIPLWASQLSQRRSPGNERRRGQHLDPFNIHSSLCKALQLFALVLFRAENVVLSRILG